MQDVRSSTNRIKRTTYGIDEKPILTSVFNPAYYFFVQEIFSNQPSCATQGCHDNVDLPNAGETVVCTRITSVVVPRRSIFRSVLFKRDLAQRPQIPLRAVSGIPQTRLEPTPPVSLGFREFQLLRSGIILNLDKTC